MMSPYYAGGLGIPYTMGMGYGGLGMGMGGMGMMGGMGGMGLGMMGGGYGMGYPYGMMMQNPYMYSTTVSCAADQT